MVLMAQHHFTVMYDTKKKAWEVTEISDAATVYLDGQETGTQDGEWVRFDKDKRIENRDMDLYTALSHATDNLPSL